MPACVCLLAHIHNLVCVSVCLFVCCYAGISVVRGKVSVTEREKRRMQL